jgi:hypothetical protein
MGLLSSIGNAFKSAVKGLSKIADVVAPICSFIPGLNPVVTAIAAGIKAVDGLTDKPPNLGKMFEGVMGMIPGGAMSKVLGSFGSGTAGKFAEMFVGAAAGKEGTGGMLGDVLSNVLSNKLVGGADSPLGGLASGLFGQVADKLRGGTFQNELTDLVTKLTGSKAGDLLNADQIAQALTRPTGNAIERLIDGAAQQVPELNIHPEFQKLIDNAIGQVTAQADRSRSAFEPAQVPLVSLGW